MSNTIKANNNSEVYINDIYRVMDEYIDELEDKSLIYDVNVYGGLLNRIYSTLFRPSKNDRVLYNSNTKLDTGDIYTLDDIWNIYTDIAAKCKRAILVEDYCLLTGISRSVFYSWANGEVRNTTTTQSDTVKKWMEQAKSSRLRGASTGNVGMIFLCKAVDGMTEAQPQAIEQDNNKPRVSAQEIAKRFEGAALPEKPNFDI